MTKFASGRTAPFLGFGVAQPVPIALNAAAYAGAFVYGQDGQMYFSNGTAWLLNAPQYFDRTGPNAAPARPVLVLGQDALAVPEANVDLALVLRGTGALQVDVPDNTVTGGAKRGEAAVDLQNERTNADQVAGANRSVIAGGRRNKIDPAAVVSFIGGGQDNVATGVVSVVGGGNGNTASGTRSTLGGGEFNVASGNRSVVGGGTSNVASNDRSTVGGGASNTASGGHSTVGGGLFNVADGDRSVVVGGGRGTARGTIGRIVLPGQGGFVSDSGATNLGTAQCSLMVLRRETTDATADVPINANNGGNTADNGPVMPDNSVYAFRGQIVCRQVGGAAGTVGDSKAWEISGAIKRGSGAGSVALLGTPTITVLGADAGLGANNSTGAVASIVTDATHGLLRVRGTGEANKTLRWVATLLLTEVVASV